MTSSSSFSAASSVKNFEVTWVVYDAKDPLGPLFALFTLSPVFIIVMYVTVILFQRDLHMFFLLMGQLLNEVLNQILKRTIRQERPKTSKIAGKGMPSAHSQFVAFFATYVFLYTLKRFSGSTGQKGGTRRLEQILTILIAFIIEFVCCYSRIRLGYHTSIQVMVGVCVGTVSGLSWFLILDKYGPRLYGWIVSWSLSQYFYVRDLSPIPDMIVHQYVSTSTTKFNTCQAKINTKKTS